MGIGCAKGVDAVDGEAVVCVVGVDEPTGDLVKFTGMDCVRMRMRGIDVVDISLCLVVGSESEGAIAQNTKLPWPKFLMLSQKHTTHCHQNRRCMGIKGDRSTMNSVLCIDERANEYHRE